MIVVEGELLHVLCSCYENDDVITFGEAVMPYGADLPRLGWCADMSEELKFRPTMLCAAALYASVDIARFIISLGCDRAEGDWRRRTPLHFAAMSGCCEVYELLDDACKRDSLGWLPLHYAVRYGRLAVARREWLRGSFENVKPSLVDVSIAAGQVGFLRSLLDVGVQAASLWRVAISLLGKGDWSLFDELVARRAPVPVRGKPPLHLISARIGGNRPVAALVGIGHDVNGHDSRGATPLHVACYFSAATALLEFGADPNALDGRGRTPLHYAAERDDGELVALLLDFGGLPCADSKGLEPVDLAGAAAVRVMREAGLSCFGREPPHVVHLRKRQTRPSRRSGRSAFAELM